MSTNDRIDELEEKMLESCPVVDCPLTHNFVPGYYIRTIFMPAGTLITSQIHNTKHCFNVSKGIVDVRVNDEEWVRLEAPHWGVTQPGTRRVLVIAEDAIWTTFHAILENEQPAFLGEQGITEAVEKITNRIIEQRKNNLLGGVLKNNKIINYVNH